MADSENPNLAVEAVEDDDYDSASDDDFNPDGAPPEDFSSSSEDEPESNTKATPKGKRKRKTEAPEELDSGDEVTIQVRQKAKKRKETGDDDEVIVFSDDEGGEGGLIKTRAQRRTEKKEHRRLAKTDGATIDVDSIWARLNSTPVGREYDITAEEKAQNEKKAGGKSQEKPGEEYISIKRTYKFAGEVHTEEKRVLKSSKEALLYLSQQAGEKDESEKENAKDSGDATPLTDAQPSIRRPLRRPSRFDPNPSGWVKALPPEHQLTWPRKSIPAATTTDTTTAPAIPQRVRASDLKPQKLNTVDKSRYDWAGYVDKEGIAEELDEYGKSKEGYLGRMDFLKSVESRQEDTRREVRLSTAANASKPAPVDMAD